VRFEVHADKDEIDRGKHGLPLDTGIYLFAGIHNVE
jgi:hypothetical protein